MFKKLIDKYLKEMPLITATIVCVLLLLFAFGCEPQTVSLLDPSRTVSRQQLEAEFDYLLQVHQERSLDLDKQEQIRQIIFQQGLIIAQGGAYNPIGIATTLLAIFGIGATVDDVKLRRKIKKTESV